MHQKRPRARRRTLASPRKGHSARARSGRNRSSVAPVGRGSRPARRWPHTISRPPTRRWIGTTGTRPATRPLSSEHTAPMAVFLALLRAVNVANTQLSMADLREVLVGLGFTNVRSLLQSGNLV